MQLEQVATRARGMAQSCWQALVGLRLSALRMRSSLFSISCRRPAPRGLQGLMAWWARMGQQMPPRDLVGVVGLGGHQAHPMSWPRKTPKGTIYRVSSVPVPAWTRVPQQPLSWAWGG
jgi:hypothetical protein